MASGTHEAVWPRALECGLQTVATHRARDIAYPRQAGLLAAMRALQTLESQHTGPRSVPLMPVNTAEAVDGVPPPPLAGNVRKPMLHGDAPRLVQMIVHNQSIESVVMRRIKGAEAWSSRPEHAIERR